jgi:lipoprotein-releasing system permease protein
MATEHPRVVAAAPFVQAQAMLTGEGTARGVAVRGVLPQEEDKVADFSQHMVSGRLDACSRRLRHRARRRPRARAARRARRQAGADRAAGRRHPAGVVPRLKQFTLVGTFDVGFNDADAGLALINLEDAQRLYQLDQRVSGVRLKLVDLFEARKVGRELSTSSPSSTATTGPTRNPNLFRAVQIEKRMMFIILTLIVAVATFNVVSTLVMLVTDKQADIAILRTLGAARARSCRCSWCRAR